MATYLEKINRYFSTLASSKCPFCECDTWISPEVPAEMFTGSEADRFIVKLPVEGTFPPSNMPVAVFICDNCGFVRMHHAVLLGMGLSNLDEKS